MALKLRSLSNTLTVIGLIALDETPAVDIDHLTLGAIIAAQHVIATDPLAKCVTDFCGPRFLLITQVSDKSKTRVRPMKGKPEEPLLTESPSRPYCVSRPRQRRVISVSPHGYTLCPRCKL